MCVGQEHPGPAWWSRSESTSGAAVSTTQAGSAPGHAGPGGSPLSSIYSRPAQCRPSREGPGQTSADQRAPWAGRTSTAHGGRCTERVSGEPLEGTRTPSRREQGA